MEDLQELLDKLRHHLEKMTPQERLDIFSNITSGFCVYCGGIDSDEKPCNCSREE